MNGPAQIQQDVDFSKIMFLIADEKAFFRDMIHTAITQAGAKDVKHATSVEKGIEIMGRFGQQIGCVICDWDMAPIGGLELLRKIRTKSLPKTPPRTAMVILTAKADAAAVKSAKALDVNGFAVAPLSVEKLIKTITNALGRVWTLQEASHYAAVPAVEVSQAEPPPSHVTPKAFIRRSDNDDAAPASAEARPAQKAPAAAKPKAPRAAELINVRMIILAEVRPGDILARDIKDQEGQLLLSTGTELRPSLIGRLKDVAGGHDESYHVWVGEWDKAS